MVNKYFKVGEVVKKAITKKKKYDPKDFQTWSASEQTSYNVGYGHKLAKERGLRERAKTMAAKKKRREYEKSPEGLKKHAEWLEEKRNAHRRIREFNKSERDQ